jgi:hypothetical protein
MFIYLFIYGDWLIVDICVEPRNRQIEKERGNCHKFFANVHKPAEEDPVLFRTFSPQSSRKLMGDHEETCGVGGSEYT